MTNAVVLKNLNIQVQGPVENEGKAAQEVVDKNKRSTTATLLARIFSGMSLVFGGAAFVMGFFFPLVVGNPYIWMGLAVAAAVSALMTLGASIWLYNPTLEVAAAQQGGK